MRHLPFYSVDCCDNEWTKIRIALNPELLSAINTPHTEETYINTYDSYDKSAVVIMIRRYRTMKGAHPAR